MRQYSTHSSEKYKLYIETFCRNAYKNDTIFFIDEIRHQTEEKNQITYIQNRSHSNLFKLPHPRKACKNTSSTSVAAAVKNDGWTVSCR